jgi:NAD(P)-dependent dehydrogenase (short-subunit alcohol dehydrogenase family)
MCGAIAIAADARRGIDRAIMSDRQLEGQWGLILGVSSGFGEACALELGRRGMGIFGVHLDRRSTLVNVDAIGAELAREGVGSRFFNVNAADHVRRREVVGAMTEALAPDGHLTLLMHSLAFGTLRPFIAARPEDAVTPAQLEMTVDVMAHSLVYWTQDLVAGGLLRRGSRVVAMTSAGSSRVIASYGAVSAAKAALESHVRQLAVELAPQGITVNCVRAGVADTPALRRIPDHERIAAEARRRNPAGRLTQPVDVARVIATLCARDTQWITGGVIGVDGGEDVVA